MKVRSQTELQEFIDHQRQWRKRELINHLGLTRGARDHLKPLLLRSGICMIYAHWEGFSKNAAIAFLEYVDHQGHDIIELSDHLVAACLRGEIRQCGESKKPTLHTELVSRLRGPLAERVQLSGAALVDTESNLNSSVLREMTCLLGVDFAPFETKAPLLDEKLIANRNSIAHGEFLQVDEADYELLHREIIGLIDELADRLLNAALLKSYLAPVAASP